MNTTETMTVFTSEDFEKSYRDDPLWQRLEAFNLDEPDADFPFSAKLAKENNWDEAFTQAAIKEYKRFIYLCCTMPLGASPPPAVDEVWHLHLCYTVNYWEHFCDVVLQRKLHHHPSKGGRMEIQRHRYWLENTCTDYHNIFGEAPPEAIWNPALLTIQPGQFTYPVKRRKAGGSITNMVLFILFVSMMAMLPHSVFAGIVIFIFAALLLIIVTSGTKAKSRNSDTSSSSCGSDSSGGCSGGGSSCGGGGGCGGGCGGCGS